MTDELPTEHFEHAEHAEHAAHSGTPFLLTVSVTIAILAVAAATVGSLESLETAAALSEQNRAALLQNKTTDQWSFFQAKSVKKNAYEIAARQSQGALAQNFSEQAARNEAESKAIREKADSLESEVETRLHEAERHEHRHHVLTVGVTLLHVAIAITTLSLIHI